MVDDALAQEAEPRARSGAWSDRWPPPSYWWKVAAGVIVVFLLFRGLAAIASILVLIMVSIVLAIGLQTPVNWLERRGWKRGSAAGLIFLAAFLVIAGFLAAVLPIIIRGISDLVDQAPDYLRRASRGSGFIADLNERFDLTQKVEDLGRELPGTAVGLIKSLGSFVFNTLTVVILTLYFTTAMPRMRHFVARLLRREHREDFEQILDESIQRVGGYIAGNLIISVIAGVISFVALTIIGVPFPVPLAVWVALADLIPTVGAILGAIVSVAVAGFAGVPELIATAAFFLVYQQVENYVIAPKVMTRAVEMSAATTIVAVLVGGSLLGFAGALLALPITAMLKIALNELYVEDRIEEVRREPG